MNFNELFPLHVNDLTTTSLFSLNKSTIELVKPYICELGPVAGAALEHLELAQQNLGISLNKSQESMFSQDVKTFNKERNRLIDKIFRITGTNIKSSDENKKSAASTMQLFIVPYKNTISQPINFETITVADMVLKYQGRPDLIDAAKTLDIDKVFSILEIKNTALDAICQSHNAEYTEHESSASNVKAAVTAYTQFCTAIEQAVNYTPTDTIAALFNKMDELRKKYYELEDTKEKASTDTPL